jgi:hypothetical protein
VDELFDTRPLCLSCYSSGGFDVHRMERLVPALKIKADRIHHRLSASNGVGD